VDNIAAKQFLISKVLEEAESERVPLSQIERKMLYFTEAEASLPDILEVNAEFEREYDANQYEDKIARLLQKARERDIQSPMRDQEWKDALNTLKKEDHYILVMVHQAFGSYPSSGRLIYAAVGIALVLFATLVALWQAKR
jgi:hypothetical protein